MMESSFLRNLVIGALTLLSVIVFVIFFRYDDTLAKASSRSEAIVLSHVKKFSQNIEKRLHATFGKNLAHPFLLEEKERLHVEREISLFVGDQYPYVYLIAKDDQGKYRYVLDGSVSEKDKGEYRQKFDPASDIWEKVFESGQSMWQVQDTITGLWMTYLHPIVLDHKVLMVLAFDFSSKEFELINEMFSPVRSTLLYISLLLSAVLIVSYFLAYLFYRQKKRASIDPLTNLFNRYFLNEVSHKLKLDHMAIAVIDLDHFKKINDMYGHLVGDIVLKEIARRFQKAIRAHDIIIRYGGEEFLLFLNCTKNKDSSPQVMERIHHEVSHEPIIVNNHHIMITFSVGMNPFPALNRSLRDAINVADKMLYVAKTNGRNRIEVYEAQTVPLASHVEQVNNAIKEGCLQAFYQPIMGIKEEGIVSYEALVRIINEDKSVSLPYEFLPFIKETTAYREMSKEMLRQAFVLIEERHVCVNVNFDTGDFFDETLYEVIYEVVLTKKSLASYLTLELLEDREIKDFGGLRERIDKLKALGVKIAIDDFGSGYSTFSYLLEISPNTLKIDGSLIRRVCKEDHAQKIVSSIVDICHSLGIKTVAEFVEDQETIDLLKEFKIDYLQGYAIGRPQKKTDLFD